MEKLNSISLGKMSLGKMSLGRVGGEMVASSGGGGPLFKRILASMPAELRESLVCWYSPNLQGLTNAELYNSDNLYVDGLHDLSGNGHNMTLYGFDGIEGGGHVNEEGNLVFDGLNDKGLYNNPLPIGVESCVMWQGVYTNKTDSSRGVILNISDYGDTYTIASICKQLGSTTYYRHGNSQKVYSTTDGEHTICINNKDLILDNTIVHTFSEPSLSLENKPMQLSAYSNNNSSLSKQILYSSIIFNRTLTDSEIDWVKTNMLVSQEVKKHNVGLWVVDDESGEFYCIDTIKVQSGNSIGKYDEEGNVIYPTYDIDATHCTDYTWYTDIECTEEYYNDTITADVNLYCKKIRISDDMLHKLSLISLDDDSTLDEHLVAWYSPKLQGLTKKSVIEDATLEDLSGNGNDTALIGFTKDEIVIGKDGELVFDGIDDCTPNIDVGKFLDYTLITTEKSNTTGSYSTKFIKNKGTDGSNGSADDYGVIIRTGTSGAYNFSIGGLRRVASSLKNGQVITFVCTPMLQTAYVNNELKETREGAELAEPIIWLSYVKGKIFGGERKELIVFDLTLSDTEIEKVKSIMLRNTPQQQKHHITFMYGDSVVEEMDVLHESNIYNLPKTELNSYIRIDKWFKDAELTEEFSNTEYITEDMTLYCSTEFIYKDMLEQLNGVVLEDGTTAREHLVCWYSPKLEGMTKDSVLLHSKMKDLSGNGYDMDLYGFDSEEEVIDTDGGLMFDGVDDYGMYELAEQQDWTYIFNISKVSKLSSGAKHIFSVKEYNVGSVMEIRTTGFWYLPNNTTGNNYSQPTNTRVLSCTPTSFNDLTFDRATFRTTYPQFYIARLRSSNNLRACFTLLSHVRFDITLTTEQIEQVKQILKLQ